MSGGSSKQVVHQKRIRFYIMALCAITSPHIDVAELSFHDTFETLRGMIEVAQRAAPCAPQVLHGEADAQVAKYIG